MRILKADELGMCFGVRDALELIETIAEPERVTIHGELVHNETVLSRLKDRGFVQQPEDRRRSLPTTEAVLITAHGISQHERTHLAAQGKTLIDSTCPLVTRAHDAAQQLQHEGYHVLVIGKPGHVEVEGIVGDLSSYTLVPCLEEVREYPQRRLGVMCQTTTPVDVARAIIDQVRHRNPDAEIRFLDTICHPTKDRQEALERLLDRVEAMVVVGGKNSNNTRQLVQRSLVRGIPAFHVQAAADLQGEWFADFDAIGLTAGTSTLAGTIDEVFARLSEFAGESSEPVHSKKMPNNS